MNELEKFVSEMHSRIADLSLKSMLTEVKKKGFLLIKIKFIRIFQMLILLTHWKIDLSTWKHQLK